jgi:uncharacterized protein YgbK (DUF1537 family)
MGKRDLLAALSMRRINVYRSIRTTFRQRNYTPASAGSGHFGQERHVPQQDQWAESSVAAVPRRIPGARGAIRAANRIAGRRLLVIDDDPTGSQTVHGVDAVLSLEPDIIARSLAEPGATCFVLTNSRSLSETEAAGISERLGALAAGIAERVGGPVEVISRSDSTLRGHLRAEIDALVRARKRAGQPPCDGILLVPSYFEAGRFTAGGVHWARVGGRPVAVGNTEFARDASFGFTHSELAGFVEEKYDGAVRAPDVRELTLDDIRAGGPDRVVARLTELPPGQGTFVVVNAADYADLDVVVLGLQAAEAAGRSFLYRTGPSFVQSLAGLDPGVPLTAATVRPDRRDGHGLVVVGSHVGLTTRQVERLLASGDVIPVILEAGDLLDDQADTAVAAAANRVREARRERDVLLMTSRTLLTGPDATASLDIARAVSAGLASVVAQVAADRLPWIITKGGITSHDILVHALGIRRAVVAGQLFPGFVSVFRPVEAWPEVIGLPCVVFAGNVGDEQTLRGAVEILRG